MLAGEGLPADPARWKGGVPMRIVRLMAYLIQIVLGALIIVIDSGGIHVGPLPGPEPLSPLFTVVGLALAIGGIGGLVPTKTTEQPGGMGGLVSLNPQPEVPSTKITDQPRY